MNKSHNSTLQKRQNSGRAMAIETSIAAYCANSSECSDYSLEKFEKIKSLFKSNNCRFFCVVR